MLEFSAVLSILNKFAGGKALFGAAGILVASLALDEISENLEKMGNLSWDQIGRGLAAMGGALAEFGIVLGLLGKFTGFSSIFAATALLIGVQSLGKLAEGLERFGEMQWDEIGRGLTAMGVALLEVGAVIGTLGVLAGFAGIIGAASLLIAIQGLDDLANALKKFGSMQWDEIGRGLAAMGAALLEVGVVVGTLGALTGFAGIIGAGALLLAIQGLDDLANALAKFGAMQWGEIGKGLVAMGAALLEVGVVTGALGALTGLAGLVGAGTLLLAVQGLDDLANALKKFGSMQWDEIGRGLAAMGAAMGEVALGGLLNTLSGFGAASISKIAEPLGVLADSVKKWAGVTVPEELGAQLGELAGGILQFTFGGWGASAIAEVAAPLGTMADSISKWSNVDITEDLGDKIGSLASGVKAFTFGGLGAGAIVEAAPGIGQLSDAVRKWDGVVVPEDLESGLTSLATGVNAFSFAFAGGWSIGTLIGPLGDLVEPVKKWNYVKVPEGIDSSLKQLADGVNAFSFSFMSGWSLDTLVGPLGDLADAARKWNGVTLEGVSQELTSFADSLKNLGTVSVSGLVLEFQNATGTLTQAVSGMLSSIISIVNTRKSGVISVFVVMVGNVLTTLNGKLPNFQTFGQLTVKYMVMGIRSQAGLPIVAFGEIITDVLSSIIVRNTEFYDAARDMVAGFANGISANTFLAEAKAAEMAAAAARAARRELDEHTDPENGNSVTITGRSLESLLSRRIVWTQTLLDGSVQDCIKKLLDENVISPKDVNRKIPNFVFETSVEKAVTEPKITAQFTGDNLYDVISEICRLTGLGFKVTLNDKKQFVFKLYAGADRTYAQTENPYVVFSPKFENIANSNYLESKKEYKNVALVAGEGEGAERKTTSVGEGSGLERRELFVDARLQFLSVRMPLCKLRWAYR